jgi:hypothetical protein
MSALIADWLSAPAGELTRVVVVVVVVCIGAVGAVCAKAAPPASNMVAESAAASVCFCMSVPPSGQW